jgi:hypothetical protein
MFPRPVTAVTLVILAAGCRRAPEPREAVDAGLAACIPADAALIAGLDVNALRASPLYSKMPGAVNALTAQFDGVSTALAAYNGRDLLFATHGKFKTTAPGATILAPDLALMGSSEQVAAAAAQYKSGHTGAPALLRQAEALATGALFWIAARGDVRLPLTGNAASLTHILRKAEFVTLMVRAGAGLTLALRAVAPDEKAASAIEETLRADLTLAAAAEAKRADVAAALRSAQVTRTGREMLVTLTISDDVAGRLFALF